MLTGLECAAACSKRRPGGATAHCPGLLGLTRQARWSATARHLSLPGPDSPGSWLRGALGPSHRAAQGPMGGCVAAVRPGRCRRFSHYAPLSTPPQARPAGAQVLLESERAERAGESLDLLLDLPRLDGAAPCCMLLTTHYPRLTTYYLTSPPTTHYSLITTYFYRRRPPRWSSWAYLLHTYATPITSYLVTNYHF